VVADDRVHGRTDVDAEFRMLGRHESVAVATESFVRKIR